MADTSRSEPTELADAVRSLQRGDVDAAEPLARAASRLALRTAAAIAGSHDEASDIAQDVTVDVLRSVNRLRKPEAFEAWVHRITVRHTLRALGRARAASLAETPLALIPEDHHPPAARESDRAEIIAARTALAAALAELPAKQRIALALRYVHDLSDAEIAAALHCRTGTVHALLSRGRAALRRHPQLVDLAPANTGG